MRAIILAAGLGIRMSPLTNTVPKCLLDIGGKSVIERQIEILHSVGVRKIILVLGYRADMVRKITKRKCTHVINQNYKTTNSIESLWLARNFLRDDLLIINGDVIFEKKLIYDLIQNPSNICFALTTAWEANRGYKIEVKNGRVVKIGPDIKKGEIFGEDAGIVKVKRAAIHYLKSNLRNFIRKNMVHCWFEDIFAEIARKKIRMDYFDVQDYLWYEFDTPEEWQHANKLYEQYERKKITYPI